MNFHKFSCSAYEDYFLIISNILNHFTKIIRSKTPF
jgi:hypothetical protein